MEWNTITNTESHFVPVLIQRTHHPSSHHTIRVLDRRAELDTHSLLECIIKDFMIKNRNHHIALLFSRNKTFPTPILSSLTITLTPNPQTISEPEVETIFCKISFHIY